MTQQNRSQTDVIPPVTLGWRLQLALNYAGLKHDVLTSKFEVSRQTITRWCRDVGAPPKKFILNEIAVMCGVSPRWLIDGGGDAGRPQFAPSDARGGDLADGSSGNTAISSKPVGCLATKGYRNVA